MTTNLEAQPTPKATDQPPVWGLVIEYLKDNYDQDDINGLIADMEARDKHGREHYGVPLTAHNGRQQLVDAYQELLDFTVYVRAWLAEKGVDPDMLKQNRRAWKTTPVRTATMIEMFHQAIEMLMDLHAEL